MRLHSLRLRAFGPYATGQEIDFGRLARSGLFLLEGPTGAGKTTILDAVTFALYGGLAGEGSGRDRLHSDFATPDAEPSVTCEFSLRGVTYRITRVPEWERPKKRGDGVTKQATQVHLERKEDGRWVSLSSGKAEVGTMITEAVGLDRDQFTQVMLLPQGEFARFLRADDDKRREVLTKLFGTQLYDRITDDLERRRHRANQQRDLAAQAICDAVSAAAEAAGLDTEERTGLLSLSRDEREARLKEVAGELAQTAALSGEGLDLAVANVRAAAAADERAKQRASLMTRLTAALAVLAAHEQTQPEHSERARLLAAARQAEPVRPLLAELCEAERQAGAARAALLALAPGSGEDALGGRGGPQARARAEAAQGEADSLSYLADREAGLPDLEVRLKKLEEDAAAAAGRVADRERAKQELPARLTKVTALLAAARESAAGLEPARQRLDAIAKRQEAAGRLAELTPRLVAAEDAVRAAVDTHQGHVEEHQRALNARLAGIASELAKKLADGIPCPVCGSRQHPTPAPPAGATVSPAQVEAARERRDAAEAARRRAEAEREDIRREVAASAAVAEGGSVAGLAADAAAMAGQVEQAQQAARDVDGLERDLSALQAQQDRVNDELRDASETAAAARTEAEKARAALESLRTELCDAAAGHESVSARQAALKAAAEADRKLGTALDELAAALAGETKARDRAEGEARGRAFATLEQARMAVLGPDEQAALAESVAAWQERLAALTQAVRADDLAGLDPAQAGEVHGAAERAAQAYARAREAEQEVRSAHEGATAKAERLRQRREDVRAADGAYDDRVEQTEAVIRLAGLAKGTDGQRRIALTTYVLRHWFGQVVVAANVRLSAMSSGRYELKRTDKGENKRQRSGLTLAVIDRHTGEERSPASLSGGETFYTSLALALGLADVVKAEAGGVDLDTLFIDEGFGSLDSGTLEEVMAVIDDLRDRGRVVGIVSHVADLKDRIPERVEVRRLPDGSSTLEVIA